MPNIYTNAKESGQMLHFSDKRIYQRTNEDQNKIKISIQSKIEL